MRIGAVAALFAVAIVGGMGLGGCYSTPLPSQAADLRGVLDMTETQEGMAEEFARAPAASFPATLAVLRVQAADRWHKGPETLQVVSLRDVESEDDLARLASLPEVGDVVALNALVAGDLATEQSVRASAARLHADLLLLYTFGTKSEVDTVVPVLDVVTLGLFPSEHADAVSTASAALVDVRTGYVYGLAEATEETGQLANSWTRFDASDQARDRAERRAFAALVDEVERMWSRVIDTHAAPTPSVGG